MNHSSVLQVLGVAGSLRRASFNRALLRAALELAPQSMKIEIFDLAPLPLYNQDEDGEHAPTSARAWRDALWAADAFLIVTPEYNYGVPGVLKNALDWASRPPQHHPLKGLPVAIMGATQGMWGTARGQAQLRQNFVFPNALVLNQPEVLIAQASEKFDATGNLTDQTTRTFVSNLLVALETWTRQVGRPRVTP
jgi:chromate reductase, NAD(P)H dehydrogenase (quinone)